ncbi:16S rRNA (uracil(1498)-N(3))-methyltransferase [Agrococcus carbonis]|uniref:Ribosomal RNA small subunit methyltransferase E n=1 Tax=Agrococcus carbonis TaxID=684552 RepID=A0A1H1L3P4_9MICO|nr:16S rRNA (uracil(1498)-N(3))-methyltransferase [Agrococcus carbonis]SDR68655.1 16S rRNA (uracil1498-N3)-methyltransferase [Agrococcus carbonis]
MAHCYWHDALAGAAAGDVVTLTGEEAHHAAVVSRMRRGERVLVSDGEGTLAEGVIDRAERDGVDVVLQRVERVPAPVPRIGLAQALAKGDRAELAVQAATELGVDAIVPWQARRSVVQWKGDRGEKALERWRKIVREAGKQAIRPHLPGVGAVVDTAGLARLADEWQLVVLEPTASVALPQVPLERDVLLVVGPEGGIEPGELEALEAAGAVPARMGDHVLRTSTAGLAGIAGLSMLLGRW